MPEKWRWLESLRSGGWKPLPLCAAIRREGHTQRRLRLLQLDQICVSGPAIFRNDHGTEQAGKIT